MIELKFSISLWCVFAHSCLPFRISHFLHANCDLQIENCHLNFPQIITIIIYAGCLVNGSHGFQNLNTEIRKLHSRTKIEIRFWNYFLPISNYKFPLITLFINCISIYSSATSHSESIHPFRCHWRTWNIIIQSCVDDFAVC